MKKLIIIIFLSILLVSCNKDNINPPKNIRLEDDTILFDEVTNIKNYEIEINEKIYKIDKPSYKLTEYGKYEVRVRSIKGKNKSNFSELYTFEYIESSNNPYIIDGDNKKYVNDSDLIINFHLPKDFLIKSISAPNNDIESSEYIILGNRVTIKESFLARKFEENRDLLVLSFVVSNNKTQYIINVYITK